MFQQVIDTIRHNGSLLVEVISYVAFAIVSHVGLAILALFIYRSAFEKTIPGRPDAYALPFVCLVLLLAALWNRVLYPVSRALEDIEPLLVQTLSPILLIGGSLLVVAITGVAAVRWARARPRMSLIVMALGVIAMVAPRPPRSHAPDGLPNIIILGIDSLRPDFVHVYGFPDATLTPALNHLLDDMVVIDGAVTPLARTFVSYMSLLTGKTPVGHGARFNLYPWERIPEQESIPRLLGRLGYFRLLAMDESRFANFPPMLGFDRQVVPEIGALDFALGSSYDMVATNLAMELPVVGPWLGYVYGNRAAYHTYDWRHHVRRLKAALTKAPSETPLFLISHLCLPHWPYLAGTIWEKSDFDKYRAIDGFGDTPKSYFRALSVADRQLGETVASLRESGRLDNALVFVISDHGESFGLDRDNLVNHDSGALLASYGHGGFVLAKAENRVVMAAQLYRHGVPQWQARRQALDASLIDIAPTIEDVVGSSSLQPEGVSLLTMFSTGHVGNGLLDRIRFLESGIRSSGVERPDIDERQVADEMAFLYRVTKDLRLEIDPRLLEGQLARKQRGAILDDLVVAAVPKATPDGFGDCWAVARRKDNTLGCTTYPALDPVIHRLQEATCQHYQHDAAFFDAWCMGGQAPRAQDLTPANIATLL